MALFSREKQGGVQGDAQKLYKAMKGWGTDESAIFQVLHSGDKGYNKQVEKAFGQIEDVKDDGENLRGWLRDELGGLDEKKALHLLDYGEPRLSLKIVQAAAGMGTDEKALIRELKKIQSASSKVNAGSGSDAKAQEADKQREEVNKNELNSKSDFKGDTSGALRSWGLAVIESRSTELIDELKIYTEGWGTDEKGLFDCVKGWSSLAANKGKGKQIVENPNHPVMRELEKELSGEEYLKAKELLERDGKLGVWRKLKLAAEGWGTDEAAMIGALESMTEKEKEDLIKEGGSRETVLRLLKGELGGRDLAKAEALLDSSFIDKATWDKLSAKVKGLGDTELESKLKAARLDPGKMEAYRQHVVDKYWGQDLADLLDLAEKALPGKRVLGPKDLVLISLAGWGSDKAGIYKALVKVPAAQRKALSEDTEFLDKVRKEIKGEWLDIVMGLLHEDTFQHTRAALLAGMKGGGTDEDILFSALQSVPQKERKGVFPRLLEELGAQLKGELNLPMYSAIEAALKAPQDPARLSAEVRLKVATEMRLGTDEEAVTDTLKDLKGKELLSWTNWDKVKNKPKATDEPHLQMDPAKKHLMSSELSSGDMWANRDLFRKKINTDGEALAIMKQDLLSRFKSKPPKKGEAYEGKAPEDAALQFYKVVKACGDFTQIEEAVQHERSGGLSAGIMDLTGTSGYELEDAMNAYQITLEKAVLDQELSEEEQKQVDKAKSETEQRLAEYKAAKASIASWASTIVAVIVGAVITVLTAGAGSGIAALMITGALAAGASAIASNVTKWLVLGDSMDWEAAGIEIVSSVLVGALTGMLQKVVQGLTAGSKFLNVDTFMKQFKAAQKLTWGQFAGKIAVANIQAQIENFVTAFPKAVLEELLKDPENFRKVMLDPLEGFIKPQLEAMGKDALVTIAKTTVSELRAGRAGGAAQEQPKNTGVQVKGAMSSTLVDSSVDLISDEEFIRKGEISPEKIAMALIRAGGSGLKAYARIKGQARRNKKAELALKESGLQLTDEQKEAYFADQASYLSPPDPKKWLSARWPRLKPKIQEAKLEQAKLDEAYLAAEGEKKKVAADTADGEVFEAQAALNALPAEDYVGRMKAQQKLSEAKTRAAQAKKDFDTTTQKHQEVAQTLEIEQAYFDARSALDKAEKDDAALSKQLDEAQAQLDLARGYMKLAEHQGNVLVLNDAQKALDKAQAGLKTLMTSHAATKQKLATAQSQMSSAENARVLAEATKTYETAIEEFRKAQESLDSASTELSTAVKNSSDPKSAQTAVDAATADYNDAMKHKSWAEQQLSDAQAMASGSKMKSAA